jgi:hypothetical protein
MDTSKLADLWSTNPPAETSIVEAVEGRLGHRLPAAYRQLLIQVADGLAFGSGITVYGTDVIEERNATYDFRASLPTHMAIGDDSGGTFIAAPLEGEGIYSVPMGFIHETELVPLGAGFTEWLFGGTPMRY